jgi:hypothetical protein
MKLCQGARWNLGAQVDARKEFALIIDLESAQKLVLLYVSHANKVILVVLYFDFESFNVYLCYLIKH